MTSSTLRPSAHRSIPARSLHLSAGAVPGVTASALRLLTTGVLAVALAASACSLLLSGPAQARDGDDHGRRGGVRAVPVSVSATPSAYVQECGACHVAYPPGLLPAASWQRLVGRLDKHFGVDASLDEAALRQVSAHVQAGAGSYRRVREVPPDDRITRSAWFVRKHDEVSARTWKLPGVKSPSNCSACHAQAQQGEFDEHDVHIPR